MGLVGSNPHERDLVAIEEVAKLHAGRVEPSPDDDRARRWWVRGEPLKAAGAAHPVGRECAYPFDESGMDRSDGVIGAGVDSQHPGFLCGPEPHREHRPKGDRHLPEDGAGMSLADDGLDALGLLDCLDPARE